MAPPSPRTGCPAWDMAKRLLRRHRSTFSGLPGSSRESLPPRTAANRCRSRQLNPRQLEPDNRSACSGSTQVDSASEGTMWAVFLFRSNKPILSGDFGVSRIFRAEEWDRIKEIIPHEPLQLFEKRVSVPNRFVTQSSWLLY